MEVGMNLLLFHFNNPSSLPGGMILGIEPNRASLLLDQILLSSTLGDEPDAGFIGNSKSP